MDQSYAETITLLVHEQNKQEINNNDLRAINLACCDLILYIKDLMNRLRSFLSKLLHCNQFGICSNAGIHVITSKIREYINYVNNNTDNTMAILSTVFSKAFNTISHKYLFMFLIIWDFFRLYFTISKNLKFT